MDNIQTQRHKRYADFIARTEPRTSVFLSLLNAFWVGGLICMLGQLITDLMLLTGVDLQTAKLVCTASLIGLAILLTGIGVFDDIAHFAGSGIILPITGFANAMASTSLEFKTEGFIFGLGTKMFNVAGPVIVNGVVWGTVSGLLYLIYTAIF